MTTSSYYPSTGRFGNPYSRRSGNEPSSGDAYASYNGRPSGRPTYDGGHDRTPYTSLGVYDSRMVNESPHQYESYRTYEEPREPSRDLNRPVTGSASEVFQAGLQRQVLRQLRNLSQDEAITRPIPGSLDLDTATQRVWASMMRVANPMLLQGPVEVHSSVHPEWAGDSLIRFYLNYTIKGGGRSITEVGEVYEEQVTRWEGGQNLGAAFAPDD